MVTRFVDIRNENVSRYKQSKRIKKSATFQTVIVGANGLSKAQGHYFLAPRLKHQNTEKLEVYVADLFGPYPKNVSCKHEFVWVRPRGDKH